MKIAAAMLLMAIPLMSQTAHYRHAANGALLPDPKVTPGVVLTENTSKVCQRGYAGSERDVTESKKRKVYVEYGSNPGNPPAEIDHLISLEIGGSNDIKNLWPQKYEQSKSEIGAHHKDAVEQYLHWAVCTDKSMTLKQAQDLISKDWTKALPAAEKHFAK